VFFFFSFWLVFCGFFFFFLGFFFFFFFFLVLGALPFHTNDERRAISSLAVRELSHSFSFSRASDPHLPTRLLGFLHWQVGYLRATHRRVSFYESLLFRMGRSRAGHFYHFFWLNKVKRTQSPLLAPWQELSSTSLSPPIERKQASRKIPLP